jgi:predicted Zn-dependent peptidase
MFERLRTQESGVYGVNVNSAVVPFASSSRFLISVSFACDLRNFERLRNAAKSEILKLRSLKVDFDILEELKQKYVQRFRKELGTSEFWCDYLLKCALVRTEFHRPFNELKAIDEVDVDGFSSFTHRLFDGILLSTFSVRRSNLN